jgi:hypothetical protein
VFDLPAWIVRLSQKRVTREPRSRVKNEREKSKREALTFARGIMAKKETRKGRTLV